MQERLYCQRLLLNSVEVFGWYAPSPPTPTFLSFFPRKNRNVPVSSSAKLLPSSKIATINQKVLKEATSNFMDDFFQLLQHYSHQLRALLRHPPPSSPRPLPPADSIFHPACSPLIPPLPTKSVSPWPLTYSFRLTCPSFLMLTRLKLAFQFPSRKRRTLQDVEQEVLKIRQASLKSRRIEPCPRYSRTPRDYCCFQNILEM